MRRPITELGYIGFEVSDLERWSRYATEVLGMAVAPGPQPDTLLLRMDERAQRIVLTRGPADDIAFAGWQAPDPQALQAFVKRLEDQGVAFEWGDDNECALRHVDRLLHFRDPSGLRHEAFCLPALGVDPFVSSCVRSGFITGAGGLGHIVLATLQAEAVIEFLGRTVGLAMTDHIRADVAPQMRLDVSFLHLNERHHSFAIARAPGQKRLHHFMVEVGTVAEVGRARDRCLRMGLAVEQDIGQHPNDRMISFYGQTPSGFLVEFGQGGVKVQEDDWQVVTYDRFSEWGHRPAPALPVSAAVA